MEQHRKRATGETALREREAHRHTEIANMLKTKTQSHVRLIRRNQFGQVIYGTRMFTRGRPNMRARSLLLAANRWGGIGYLLDCEFGIAAASVLSTARARAGIDPAVAAFSGNLCGNRGADKARF